MGPGCDPGHGSRAPAPPRLPPASPSSLRTPVTELGLPSLTPPGPLLGGQHLQRSLLLTVRAWDVDPHSGAIADSCRGRGVQGRGKWAAAAHGQQDACGLALRPGCSAQQASWVPPRAPSPPPGSSPMQASTRSAWCCQRVDETVGEQPLTGPSGMSTQEEGGMMRQGTGTPQGHWRTRSHCLWSSGCSRRECEHRGITATPPAHPDLAPSVQFVA